MSRGRQKVSFEGLLHENVLGTFKVIRGFADLIDLAEVSVAMQYQGAQNGLGSGYQRQIDEQHVEDIKRFLSKGRYRFFPETCEVGYAKSRGIPFILTFHKRTTNEKPPWERESSPNNKVHFDLMPYRYIAYENAFQLRDKQI